MRKGFTLLELLITLTILGLVMAAVYGALFKTLEVRTIIEEETAGPREALALLELMSADFRAAVRPEPLEGGGSGTGGTGGSDNTRGGREAAPFHGKAARNADGRDADQVHFIASVTSRFAQDARKMRGEDLAGLEALDPDDPEARQIRAALCEVSYLLKDDPEKPGLMHLFRREDFHVDTNPTKGGAYLRLHSRVRGLKFRYYKGDEGSTGRDPEENWKIAEQKRLPAAVEIELTIDVTRIEEDESGDSGEPKLAVFRTIVPILAGRMGSSDPEEEEAAPAGSGSGNG